MKLYLHHWEMLTGEDCFSLYNCKNKKKREETIMNNFVTTIIEIKNKKEYNDLKTDN